MAVCIDPLVINFDPHSDCDDGMCVYGIDFCGLCTIWYEALGICMEDPACQSSACPGDFTGDGFVNVSDLGGFLGAFGTQCE